MIHCLGMIADMVVLNPGHFKQILHRDYPQMSELAKRLRQKGPSSEKMEITLRFYENHANL